MEKGPVVCLVHGLWMTGLEMYLLKKRLVRAGLHCVNFSYQSTSKDVGENAKRLAGFLAEKGIGQPFFVCHSYGGLVVCRYLSGYCPGPGIKVVFLGTPINGASLAKRLGDMRLVQMITGKSLPALKKGCGPGPGGIHFAMIAGSVNIGLGMFFLKGKADGMVAVADTVAPWLEKHSVVRCSHLFLLFSKKASRLCIEFLGQ